MTLQAATVKTLTLTERTSNHYAYGSGADDLARSEAATGSGIDPRMQMPLVVFAVCVVVGVGVSLVTPRLYESHARVWVQMGGAGGAESHQSSPYVYSNTSPIATACEVMRSETVLKHAEEALHQKFPDKTLPGLEEMRKHILIEPVRNTSVIEVAYHDSHDWVATGVVQAVIDSFVQSNSAPVVAADNQSQVNALEAELKTAQSEHALARDRYRQERQNQKGGNLEEQVSTFLKERSQLDGDLNDARSMVAGLESKVAFLEAQLGTTAENALNDEKLTKDLTVQNLRKKIADDEVHLVSLRSRFEDAHPKVRDTLEAIAAGKTALSDRIQMVMGPPTDTVSGYSSERLPPDSQMRQSLLSDLVRAKTEQITLEAKIISLKALIAEVNRKMQQVPGQQVSMQDLSRQEREAFDRVADLSRRLHSVQGEALSAGGAAAPLVRIIDQPTVPKSPIAPDLAFPVGVSALIGFVLAMLAGLLSNAKTPRLTNPQEVATILDAPVLSWVEPVGDNLEAMVPALRRLRVALKGALTKGTKKVFITSADTTDGKVLVSAGLALSVADTGQRVLLIDANFEKPGVHQLFNIPAAPGLSNYLKDPAAVPLPRLVNRVNSNLLVIAAGTAGDSGQLLSSPSFHRLMNELGAGVDLIIVDTPSALGSVDALSLANGDTLVLVVVKLVHTLRHMLRQFAVQLQQQGTNCQIVLTNANSGAVSNLPSFRRSQREEAAVS